MSGLEHEIAIDISRALNLVNPNDLLARQVIQIARNHKQANGFVKACAGFGRFKDEALFDIYTKIHTHDSEHGVDGPAAASSNGRQSSNNKGSSVQESSISMTSKFARSYEDDDEEPEQIMQGGLVIKPKKVAAGDDRHVFKAPTLPAGVSRLGLDRLAKEKREEKERETTEIGEMIGRGGLLIDGMTATGDLLTGETTGLERALHQGGQTLQSPGVLAPAEVNGMPRPPGLEATLMPFCKAG
ncbi:hypothetical protein K457DRAFT_318984 [Linnemannia elongata AG-77]|uniref:Uncharacterized protein n=1 Tax=Linnemannia elongata AG-77 TaxID=1314771 RepID=A0A197K3A1_9FUNG|nr:hypothetical protein K457DRAFT_318984 [Linnemannia elongata AG-77]